MVNKAFINPKYQKAELLYILSGKPLIEIAAEVGVGIGTVNRWVKDYKWKEKASLCNFGIENVITRCMSYIKELESNFQKPSHVMNASEIDCLYKLIKTIAVCQEEISLPMTINTLNHFSYWLRSKEITPNDQYILEQINAFIKEKTVKSTQQATYLQSLKYFLINKIK